MAKRKWHSVLLSIFLLASIFPFAGGVSHAESTRYFPETGHTVKGLFLDYWDTHGGLTQQGYPITEEVQEQSDTDHKTYTMQYFERAVFEAHPENQAPYNVLLTLVGKSFYQQRYAGNAPNQRASTSNPRKFAETGKTIGGVFRGYWETHGGLAQQGYPLSDEFQEKSQTDGRTYTVQYFERAVFEYHPDFESTPSQVQLSLLGVLYYQARHGVITEPTVVPPQPTPSVTPVGGIVQMLFLKANGTGQLALIDSVGNIFADKPVSLPARNYSSIESLGGGYIFAYDWNGTGVLGQVDEQGVYHNIKTLALSPEWPHITSFQNALIFYTPKGTSPGIGVLDVVRLRVPVDGGVTGERKLPIGNHARMMAATSGGVLVTYFDDDQHGYVDTYRIDSNNYWSFLKERRDLPTRFTNLIRLQNDDMLFYNRYDGSTFIGRIASDGTFTQVHASKTAQNWTALSQGTNDIFVTYNRSNGVIYTMQADYRSNRFAILGVFGPGGPVGSGWDYVVSLR